MRWHAVHTLNSLELDLRTIPVRGKAAFARTVRGSAEEGLRLAKGLAQSKAGPHGRHYHKRLHAEAHSSLEWEYGPDGSPKSEFVGAGYRSGRNTDLPQSADVVGPAMARGIRKDLDGLFW